MVRGAGVSGWRGIVAAGLLLSASGPAGAQSQVETITPEAANRSLSFQDWCEGIKNYGSARCNEQRPEDRAAFDDAKGHLRTMGIGPRRTLSCDVNPSVNPNRNWIGGKGCRPATEPPPDLQPFGGPR